MSILIDELISPENLDVAENIPGTDKWCIAKPYGKARLIKRIKDAFRVLTGKSFAVHYYEDS